MYNSGPDAKTKTTGVSTPDAQDEDPSSYSEELYDDDSLFNHEAQLSTPVVMSCCDFMVRFESDQVGSCQI